MERVAALFQSGQNALAEKACRRVVREEPDLVIARRFLFCLLILQQKHREALRLAPRLQKEIGSDTGFQRDLAACYISTNRSKKALELYENRLSEFPDDIFALQGKAQALSNLENIQEALEILVPLAEKNPQNTSIWYVTGLCHVKARDYTAAKQAQLQVLRTDPHHEDAAKALALLFELDRNYTGASHLIESLLKKSPNNPDLLQKMGNYFRHQGRGREALRYLRRAARIKRKKSISIQADLLVPASIPTREGITQCRRRFGRNLKRLIREKPKLKNPMSEIGVTNFYLAYQGKNDRKLQEGLAKLYEGYYPKSMMRKRRKTHRRIRIGFVCNMFYTQSVMHFYEQMIRQMPDDFEVILFSTTRRKDTLTALLEAQVHRFYDLPEDLKKVRRAIAKEELDILVYPEIGMSSLVYCLGLTRLAPVQCVMMGHPVTSGLPAMDYYLSSAAFEEPEAQAHYTEKLIRIPGMPVYYEMPKLLQPKSKAELGMPTSGRVYFCPVTLFKIHPDFDRAIAEILRQDSEAWIQFVSYAGIEWVLKERFEKFMPDVCDRIIFHAPFSFQDYLAALAVSDAVIESFPFGGGNTMLHSFSVNTPAVTLENNLLSGRFGAGYYRLMGLEELIFRTPEAYVTQAIRVANDKDYRQKLSHKIAENKSKLFSRTEGIQAHYDFFRSVAGSHKIA